MSTLADHTQLFARIRVHGLTKSPSGDPCPITLERWTSFPAPSEVIDEPPISSSEITDLSSRALAPKFEVDVRVRFDTPSTGMDSPEGSLGSGRAGLVYALEVVSVRRLPSPAATNSADEEYLDSIPLPPLCIKVASPGYARALARKAWFYEQIDSNGLTGILAPRCYGVFRACLGEAESSAGITVDIPEYDYYEAAAQPIYCDSQLYTSLMAEEKYDRETNALELSSNFIDDSKGRYASSPWTNLRETPESTTLTVLIMDQLGEPLTAQEMDRHVGFLTRHSSIAFFTFPWLMANILATISRCFTTTSYLFALVTMTTASQTSCEFLLIFRYNVLYIVWRTHGIWWTGKMQLQ